MSIRFNLLTWLIIAGVLLTGLWLGAAQVVPSRAANQPATLSHTPLMFIENVGQFPDEARFQVWGGEDTIWLAEDGWWVTVVGQSGQPQGIAPTGGTGGTDKANSQPSRQGVHLKLGFVGSNPNVTIEPFARLDTKVSYFRGNDPSRWRSDVPTWGGVRYKNLYPGIDLELSTQDGSFAPRLVAHEGAELSVVRWHVEGARGDDFTPSAPRTTEVVTTSLSSPSEISSLTLDYSTFVGGSGNDGGRALALAPNGEVVVTGRTESSDFPTTAGAFDVSHGGRNDVLVAKVASDGSQLRYVTFIGGAVADEGVDLALDGDGNVVLTGYTFSSDFPSTADAYQPTHSGEASDLFVLKLAADGGSLLYSTLLGGNNTEAASALALDGNGDVIVTGYTYSDDFPTTKGAYDTTHNGFADGFVLKLAANGSALLYNTLVGGSNLDEATALALTTTGEVVITGFTESADFPTSEGAFDRTHNQENDLFVLKLAADGSALLYSTFVGGAESDWGYGLALSANGQAVVTGDTSSAQFPTTAGAYNRSFNGQRDVFVLALSEDGSSLLYSTFVGGDGFDYGYDVALAQNEQPVVIGWTESSDFPTTSDAYDDTHNGGGTYGRDAYLLRLAADGTSLRYSTFIGGSDDDYNQALLLSNEGDAVITGYTYSADFPTSDGAYDSTHHGALDLFVMRFDGSTSSPTPTLTPTATASHTVSPTSSPTVSATATGSVPPTATQTPTLTPIAVDEYEPDDNCKDARPIPSDGTIQTHTFHHANDEDWASFPVQQGKEYIIEGRVPPESAVDLVLQTYDGCDGEPDEQNPSFSVTIRYRLVAPADGSYYLRLYNQDSTQKSNNNEYHLSVRELNQLSYGALIIVAGKFRDNDPLQANIHHVTNRVYRTFRQQGHPDEQIYYLADDINIDLDGNGTPDVDGLPSRDNLQYAITQWAAQYVGTNQALTLFMVDHGRQNRFYLDGTRNDWVTPTDLNAWLTQLEEQTSVKANIIIDASRSGSFIEGQESISKEGRVVITSTDDLSASHASQRGLHFSDALLSALAQGMSVKAAFDEATWALRQLPPPIRTRPLLDSDGNGIANQPSDEPEAERRGFNSPGTFPTEQWAPDIKNAQISALKGTQVQLSAEVLDDEKNGVQSVSAVIYPPSYQPTANEDEIITEPNRLTLTKGIDVPHGAQYHLTYDTFNEQGTYQLLIYAEDGQNVGAQPVVLELSVGADGADYALFLPLLLR